MHTSFTSYSKKIRYQLIPLLVRVGEGGRETRHNFWEIPPLPTLKPHSCTKKDVMIPLQVFSTRINVSQETQEDCCRRISSTHKLSKRSCNMNTTKQVTSLFWNCFLQRNFGNFSFCKLHKNCSRKIFKDKNVRAKFWAHEIRRYPRTRTTCLCLVLKGGYSFYLNS